MMAQASALAYWVSCHVSPQRVRAPRVWQVRPTSPHHVAGRIYGSFPRFYALFPPSHGGSQQALPRRTCPRPAFQEQRKAIGWNHPLLPVPLHTD
jgi:hypothetical protein